MLYISNCHHLSPVCNKAGIRLPPPAFYSSDVVPRCLLCIQRLYYRRWFMLRMQAWSALISIFLAPFSTFVAHYRGPTYKCLCVSIWTAVFVFHLDIGLLESTNKLWSRSIHFQYVCCGSFSVDYLFTLTNEPTYTTQIQQALLAQISRYEKKIE